ncbi:MAG: GreA/GreB family elongation factor [Mucilaginibacter sp.]
MRKRFQLTLTIEDFKLLMKYYFTKGLSVFNKRKLFVELNDAHIVSEINLPLNVARQGSKVLVRNIGKNQTYRVHIVPQYPGPARSSEILISDPLSIALLGYSDGHRTEWEMKDGIQQLEIISVHRDEKAPELLIAGSPELYPEETGLLI